MDILSLFRQYDTKHLHLPISNRHLLHHQVNQVFLKGGDIHSHHCICDYIHTPSEHNHHKIFIAGNHDWGFELHNDIAPEYKEKGVHYLFDSEVVIDGVKFYGSPWQPEFYNWAFNLPRNGEELKSKWDAIPNDTDILITHYPAFGYLDDVEGRRGQHLGCELLTERIKEIKPKIHVCGHIHSGRNIYHDGYTLFINASILDERYKYTQSPITIDYNFSTGLYDVIQF